MVDRTPSPGRRALAPAAGRAGGDARRHDRTGPIPVIAECPGCGFRAALLQRPREREVLSDIALVFGVLSAIFGYVTSAFAIILGVVALQRMRQGRTVTWGRPAAMAALVLGIVCTFLGLVSLMTLREFLSSEARQVADEILSLPQQIMNDLGL